MANSQEKVHSWVFIPQFLEGEFSSIVPYPNKIIKIQYVGVSCLVIKNFK